MSLLFIARQLAIENLFASDCLYSVDCRVYNIHTLKKNNISLL